MFCFSWALFTEIKKIPFFGIFLAAVVTVYFHNNHWEIILEKYTKYYPSHHKTQRQLVLAKRSRPGINRTTKVFKKFSSNLLLAKIVWKFKLYFNLKFQTVIVALLAWKVLLYKLLLKKKNRFCHGNHEEIFSISRFSRRQVDVVIAFQVTASGKVC